MEYFYNEMLGVVIDHFVVHLRNKYVTPPILLTDPLLAGLGLVAILMPARYVKEDLFVCTCTEVDGALKSYNCGCPLECLSSLLSNHSSLVV